MSFLTHEQNGLVWLTSSLLDGVCHGFSTRQGGVSQPPFDTLNLAPGRDDDPAAVRENYRRFCGTLGVDPARTVLSKQVHEATVRLCTEADAGKGLLSPRDYAADALITRDANLPLVVFSADCGILLLYDPIHRAVGAIHAGLCRRHPGKDRPGHDRRLRYPTGGPGGRRGSLHPAVLL